MATVDIKNLNNEVVGKLDLADAVFGGPDQRRSDAPRREAVPGEPALRHSQDEDPRGGFRQRQKAVAAKRHGPRARR